MFHIALWEPEIPPNTGNIARTCVATGTSLHLIGRLGFQLDDRSLVRAGVDYWHEVDVHRYDHFADFEAAFREASIYCLTAQAPRSYTQVAYRSGDVLLFGSESRGLPEEILARYAGRAVGIPMPTGKVRNLNLATSVGIVLYEGLRQLHQW